MEKESLRNGTAFTTMLTTMIWEILTRVQSMSALFLVDLLSTLILVGAELAEHQQNQVITGPLCVISHSCYHQWFVILFFVHTLTISVI